MEVLSILYTSLLYKKLEISILHLQLLSFSSLLAYYDSLGIRVLLVTCTL